LYGHPAFSSSYKYLTQRSLRIWSALWSVIFAQYN
jgi:hypothetical protein